MTRLYLFFIIFLITIFPRIAWAIPSPDLVINLFGSLAQLIGMMSVVFGGAAYSLRRYKKTNGGSPWPLRISLILLAATWIGFGLYISHHLDLDNKRLRANLTRSSMEEGEQVGDASLKTLSFSEQVNHPGGITTDRLAESLEEVSALNLIDVREPEEIEAGLIPGAWHRRYPDLLENRKGLTREGRRTILLCYSGNRSSELCDLFSRQGIDCNFLIGGYEKWMAEGRPLASDKRSSETLRSLPSFPNNDVLLSTEEVGEAFRTENALFVDVRYPKDFETGHLPGAINIPLRKLPKDQMWSALKNLPKSRPVIAPCYDKRSCFYSLILGLRLSRLGYDFRGRYTTPHEFILPPREKAHVKEWIKQKSGKTFFGIIGKPIQWIIYGFRAQTGSAVWAIFLTVVVLRLIFLPFSIKNELDRLKQLKRAPQVAKLKKRLKSEPVRLQRALRSISREDRARPGFNAIGNILQIIVFIVMFTVVNEFAEAFGGQLLWIKSLSDADPFYVLPVLVSSMLFAYLFFTAPNPSKMKMAFYSASAVGIFFLTFKIPAALNVYLSINLVLLIIHGFLIRSWFRRIEQSESRHDTCPPIVDVCTGIVPLKKLGANSGCGNKALKLAGLIRGGFPVPDGFSISCDIFVQDGGISDNDRRKIKKAWDGLGTTRAAVRSSGMNEDGSEKSYAGIFESRLNVAWDDFYDALVEVAGSLKSSRVEAYSDQAEAGGIFVQKMVDAEYSGVLFTEHPGTSGSMLVELIPGLGESLVGGKQTPESHQFGRYTINPMSKNGAPIDLKPLLELGKRVEDYQGRPQDIEWAFADGKFQLLQTRDITSDSRHHLGWKGLLERERFRLLDMFKECRPDEIVLCQDDLTTLLPNASRLSLSLMNRFWEPGGTVDLACTRLGIPYPVEENARPYLVSGFGGTYVNAVEKRKRLGKSAGIITSFRLARAAEGLAKEFRKDFLPALMEQVLVHEALDFNRFSLRKLVRLFKLWERTFVTKTYVQAEMINIAAESYMNMAIKQLEKRGENPAEHLGRLPETVIHRAMSLLPLIRDGRRDVLDFLNIFGFRAPLDFELSMPRYNETPELVADMASRTHEIRDDHKSIKTNSNSRVLDLAVKRAVTFQALKEEAKHYCLREFALFRPLLLEIDRRLEMDGGIFHLNTDEVLRLSSGSFANEALKLVENRRRESFRDKRESLPIEFTLRGVEQYGLELSSAVEEPSGTTMLGGIRISGTGIGVGRVRVLSDPEDMDVFQKDEILVARFTDPNWTPLFSLAAGVITEIGGWLSHAAIVARELNLPGIVGVRNATHILKTGDFVTLHEDGTIEIDPKSTVRGNERYPVERNLIVVWNGLPIDVRLLDISRSGALVEASPSEAEFIDTETTGSMQLIPGYERRGITATRLDNDRFALRFTKLLDPQIIDDLRKEKPVYL